MFVLWSGFYSGSLWLETTKMDNNRSFGCEILDNHSIMLFSAQDAVRQRPRQRKNGLFQARFALQESNLSHLYVIVHFYDSIF